MLDFVAQDGSWLDVATPRCGDSCNESIIRCDHQCYAAMATEFPLSIGKRFAVHSFTASSEQILVHTLDNRTCTFDRWDTRVHTYLEESKSKILKQPFHLHEWFRDLGEEKGKISLPGPAIVLAPGCIVVPNFVLKEDVNRLYAWCCTPASFHSTRNEYPNDYRNSERMMVDSQEWSDLWWTKLKPLLLSQAEQFRSLRPVGFGSSGGWAPIGINSYFRFSKYQKGQKFAKHTDVRFCTTTSCSLLTMLVYLNDDYERGETVLYPQAENQSKPISYHPSVKKQGHGKGSALIFPHGLPHEGSEVTNGTKIILRMDIMFHRLGITTQELKDEAISMNDNARYLAVRHAYRQSVLACQRNEPSAATSWFLQAAKDESGATSHATSYRASLASLPIYEFHSDAKTMAVLSQKHPLSKIANRIINLGVLSFLEGKNVAALACTSKFAAGQARLQWWPSLYWTLYSPSFAMDGVTGTSAGATGAEINGRKKLAKEMISYGELYRQRQQQRCANATAYVYHKYSIQQMDATRSYSFPRLYIWDQRNEIDDYWTIVSERLATATGRTILEPGKCYEATQVGLDGRPTHIFQRATKRVYDTGVVVGNIQMATNHGGRFTGPVYQYEFLGWLVARETLKAANTVVSSNTSDNRSILCIWCEDCWNDVRVSIATWKKVLFEWSPLHAITQVKKETEHKSQQNGTTAAAAAAAPKKRKRESQRSSSRLCHVASRQQTAAHHKITFIDAGVDARAGNFETALVSEKPTIDSYKLPFPQEKRLQCTYKQTLPVLNLDDVAKDSIPENYVPCTDDCPWLSKFSESTLAASAVKATASSASTASATLKKTELEDRIDTMVSALKTNYHGVPPTWIMLCGAWVSTQPHICDRVEQQMIQLYPKIQAVRNANPFFQGFQLYLRQ